MSFQKIIHVVNRSTENIEVTDDGVPWVIRPGYKRVEKLGEDGKPMLDPETNQPLFDVVGAGPGGSVFMEPLPYFAAERGKRQNPVMGTEDPFSPTEFDSLVAVPEWGDDYSPIEQSNAIERLDRSMLGSDEQKAVVIPARGARREIKKRGSNGQFVKAVQGARSYTDATLENPAGIRLS